MVSIHAKFKFLAVFGLKSSRFAPINGPRGAESGGHLQFELSSLSPWSRYLRSIRRMPARRPRRRGSLPRTAPKAAGRRAGRELPSVCLGTTPHSGNGGRLTTVVWRMMVWAGIAPSSCLMPAWPTALSISSRTFRGPQPRGSTASRPRYSMPKLEVST
jgi:hypothetical protein